MKNIELSPYNANWAVIFEKQAFDIQKALSSNKVAIHHIGSTSVAGLLSKPKIDIIAVVKKGQKSINQLESMGFTYKGEWNIPFKYGFTKREEMPINLHVFEEDHPEIELNLLFRDYLRTHNDARDAYARLKQKIIEDPTSHERTESGFPLYTLRKADFIRHIIGQTHFNRFRMIKCAHVWEWDHYHRIRRTLIFEPMGVIYDPHHPTLTNAHHHHFLLLQGITPVGVAHIEKLSPNTYALRPFAIDIVYQNKGWGSYFLTYIEEWLQRHGTQVLKLHANPQAVDFYTRLGYQPMNFEENKTPLSIDTIDMGKYLK